MPSNSETTVPFKDRPKVDVATQYGDTISEAGFWVEYPSGLVDLTRSHPLTAPSALVPPPDAVLHLDIPCDADRTIRVDKASTAIVIVDMQNFFLHKDLRDHPKGLACVDPLLNLVPALRSQGIRIIWLNWGLTPHELHTIPPALARSFSRHPRGGFGSSLPDPFGKLLMRGEHNAALYGPLQDLYEAGAKAGTDDWVHKNRISGLWGYQTALDLHLKENGLRTLLFAGVNTDQCVMGTVADAYFRGYDVAIIKDATATSSPEGAYENVLYNVGGSYGFLTDSDRILAAVENAGTEGKVSSHKT